MPSLVSRLLKDQTRKNVIVNTVGNNLNVVFTAFFALVLVRILEPTEYGVLSVLLGIAYVLANILDFGTSATIYSYLPPLMEDKFRLPIYRFVKSTFYYQTLFSLIVIVTLMLTFPFLDDVFFRTGAPVLDLYLTSISVLLFIWQNFVWNCMAAAKRFLKVNLYINAANVFKTLVLGVIWYREQVTISSVLFVFGILGPTIFFLLLLLQKRSVLKRIFNTTVSRSELRVRYTATYFLASQFFNLGLRMDLFLLSYFGMKAETGYYGLSQKIILTIITTVVSITQVLSPMFSNAQTKQEIKKILRTGLIYLSIPAAVFVVLAVFPASIFELVFTNKFSQTAEITHALSIPFIIYSLGSLPLLFLLYTVKKPKYILYSNIVFFIILTGGCIYLIPIKGVFGPPIAITAAMTIATLMLTAASVREYGKIT